MQCIVNVKKFISRNGVKAGVFSLASLVVIGALLQGEWSGFNHTFVEQGHKLSTFGTQAPLETHEAKCTEPCNITSPVYQDESSMQEMIDAPTAKNTSKPVFLLHVGPGKMATTTMQEDLRSLTLSGILEKDNYAYVGLHRAEKSVIQAAVFGPACLKQMVGSFRRNHSFESIPCWRNAASEIERRRYTNTNLILSDERIANNESPLWSNGLFKVMVAALKQTLGDDWDVMVVIGYRRYYEWVLSSLKQLHGQGCAHEKTNWDRNYCPAPWPPIRDWMNRNPPSAKNYHFTDSVIERWRGSFPIKLLNYHAPERITETLLCDLLPNAPHTCQHLRTSSLVKSANVRSATTGAYSSIALEAYHRGVLPSGMKRTEAIQSMERHWNKELGLSYRDLPLIECPPHHELELLLNISLTFERDLLSEWHHALGILSVTDHRENFWHLALEEKVFCSVDIKGIVDNKTSWEDILQSLDQTKNISGA